MFLPIVIFPLPTASAKVPAPRSAPKKLRKRPPLLKVHKVEGKDTQTKNAVVRKRFRFKTPKAVGTAIKYVLSKVGKGKDEKCDAQSGEGGVVHDGLSVWEEVRVVDSECTESEEGDFVEAEVSIGDISVVISPVDEVEEVAGEDAPLGPAVVCDTPDVAPLVVQPRRVQEGEGCIACVLGIAHEAEVDSEVFAADELHEEGSIELVSNVLVPVLDEETEAAPSIVSEVTETALTLDGSSLDASDGMKAVDDTLSTSLNVRPALDTDLDTTVEEISCESNVASLIGVVPNVVLEVSETFAASTSASLIFPDEIFAILADASVDAIVDTSGDVPVDAPSFVELSAAVPEVSPVSIIEVCPIPDEIPVDHFTDISADLNVDTPVEASVDVPVDQPSEPVAEVPVSVVRPVVVVSDVQVSEEVTSTASVITLAAVLEAVESISDVSIHYDDISSPGLPDDPIESTASLASIQSSPSPSSTTDLQWVALPANGAVKGRDRVLARSATRAGLSSDEFVRRQGAGLGLRAVETKGKDLTKDLGSSRWAHLLRSTGAHATARDSMVNSRHQFMDGGVRLRNANDRAIHQLEGPGNENWQQELQRRRGLRSGNRTDDLHGLSRIPAESNVGELRAQLRVTGRSFADLTSNKTRLDTNDTSTLDIKSLRANLRRVSNGRKENGDGAPFRSPLSPAHGLRNYGV